MDKLENWVTWILMAALYYRVTQIEQGVPCAPSGSGWPLVDTINSPILDPLPISGLNGFRGNGSCNCGGMCGSC